MTQVNSDAHTWAGTRGSSVGLGEWEHLAPNCAGLEGLPGVETMQTGVEERGLLGHINYIKNPIDNTQIITVHLNAFL